jgi:hypothetical protein
VKPPTETLPHCLSKKQTKHFFFLKTARNSFFFTEKEVCLKNAIKTGLNMHCKTLLQLHRPWTNLSQQDKTWAEFSTLGMGMLVYAVKLHS